VSAVHFIVTQLNGHSTSYISGLVKGDTIIFGHISEGAEDTVPENTENHHYGPPDRRLTVVYRE